MTTPPTPPDADPDVPAPPARDPRLTSRQAAFVTAYLDTRNGAEAARRAGFSCPTPHAAAAVGTRLLSNAVIKEAVKEGLDAAWAEAHASRSERISILSRIMRGEPVDGLGPPTFAERIQAGRVLTAMLDPQKVQVDSRVSYVVPLPDRAPSAEAWAAMAKQQMAELDSNPNPGQRPEGT